MIFKFVSDLLFIKKIVRKLPFVNLVPSLGNEVGYFLTHSYVLELISSFHSSILGFGSRATVKDFLQCSLLLNCRAIFEGNFGERKTISSRCADSKIAKRIPNPAPLG